MSKVTFEVDDDLKAEMDRHPEINWSEALRQAVRRQIEAQKMAESILMEMEREDVKELASELKAGTGERFRKAKESAE